MPDYDCGGIGYPERTYVLSGEPDNINLQFVPHPFVSSTYLPNLQRGLISFYYSPRNWTVYFLTSIIRRRVEGLFFKIISLAFINRSPHRSLSAELSR